jgi:hypothetical protein
MAPLQEAGNLFRGIYCTRNTKGIYPISLISDRVTTDSLNWQKKNKKEKNRKKNTNKQTNIEIEEDEEVVPPIHSPPCELVAIATSSSKIFRHYHFGRLFENYPRKKLLLMECLHTWHLV